MFPDCTFVGKCYFSHNKVFLIATEMVYCWIESINRSRKQSWVTFSSVQLLSCVQLFATPWTAALQASLSITNSRACSNSCPSGGDAVQPSHLLSSPSPPAFNLSQHQDLSNESVFHIRWPKYWSFSFSISPSNEYSGLFSFRIDWFDLLAVQGTLKSLLQHHSSKASILQHSGFFRVQLSHPYMTTGKTIAVIRRTFVGKVMSLLFKCSLGWP